VEGADVVNTDVWASMGQEEESQKRPRLRRLLVDDALMARASDRSIFLHCLPAHRGEEVSDSVIEGPRSRVFDEAENRLHVQKAIMVKLMARNQGGDPDSQKGGGSPERGQGTIINDTTPHRPGGPDPGAVQSDSPR
jgi:hypothetical protein